LRWRCWFPWSSEAQEPSRSTAPYLQN